MADTKVPNASGSRIIAPLNPDESMPARRGRAEPPPWVWRGPREPKTTGGAPC